MFYSPKKNKKALVTSAALLALFSALNMASPLFGNFMGAVAAVSLVFLVAVLYVLLRFSVGSYAYEITSDTFVITKTTGRKSVTVAALLLGTAYGVVKTPETKEERAAFSEKFGTVDVRMNYYHNIFAKTHVYVTEFNGKTYAFKIEVDDDFAEKLNAAISSKKDFF